MAARDAPDSVRVERLDQRAWPDCRLENILESHHCHVSRPDVGHKDTASTKEPQRNAWSRTVRPGVGDPPYDTK